MRTTEQVILMNRRCQKVFEIWTVFTEGRVTERVKRRWVRNMEGPYSRETKCTEKGEGSVGNGPEPFIKDNLEE